MCIKKHGGALYRAKRCHAHDKQLKWNEQGPRGPQGIPGPRGIQGPFPAILPSGQSLKGVYRASETAAGDPVPDTVTFVFPLASKPTVHFIAPLAQSPTECPGTPDNPQAAPGNLCVYATHGNNDVSIANPETSVAPDASPRGFTVFDDFLGGETNGTWAVTAP